MPNHAANTTNDNASLGFDNMPVRFFCYAQDETRELDIMGAKYLDKGPEL